MNNLRDFINVALPLVVALVVALSTVLLVAMMVPILVPVAVVGLVVLILWLWLRGNGQPNFMRRKQRDYSEDFR